MPHLPVSLAEVVERGGLAVWDVEPLPDLGGAAKLLDRLLGLLLKPQLASATAGVVGLDQDPVTGRGATLRHLLEGVEAALGGLQRLDLYPVTAGR